MLFIDTLEAAEAWVEAGAPEAATVQGVDLSGLDPAFGALGVRGSAFLGCVVGDLLHAAIRRDGAGLVTDLPALPSSLPAFAPGIYTVADLYDGLAADGSRWESTPDYAGYFFLNERKNVPRKLEPVQALAARLHDTVQEQAVREFLKDRDVVAIMGGHDFKRQLSKADSAAGKPDVYWDCVAIAKALTEKGFFILTGGGPGVMEAGNLGALLAGETDAVVGEVRAILTYVGFEEKRWRSTAMAARARILGSWDAEPPESKLSLGIPTWFYGHEPPNMFASHHSKMFFNSLREDGLVTLANKGIIFFEGNAGTVQEIFQDATQNYYVGEGQSPTPMIFYNAGGYWERSCTELSWPTDMPMDKRKPLMPLLKQLAIEKKFQNSVLVTRSPEATIKFLVDSNVKPVVTKADVNLGNAVASK
jgi:predicted Rossmann-fold nucleotide-binding protein